MWNSWLNMLISTSGPAKIVRMKCVFIWLDSCFAMTFSSLLAICEVNPPVTVGFPSQIASNVELWCLFFCANGWTISCIGGDWDAMMRIWRHRNVLSQVLKLYAWEEAFQQRLQGIRNQELGFVRKAAIFFSGTVMSFSCSTVMVRTPCDVMTCKDLPHYWPLVKGIYRSSHKGQ